MNVLIVDDNSNNRMVLRLLLEDYAEDKKEISLSVSECENGSIAVNKSKLEKFDIIFMDIMMPEMDGIEATKKIRSNNKEVMIIAVSAVDEEDKQKEILRNGAEDYIPKPIDSELLISRLESYLPLLKTRRNGNLSTHTKASNLYTKNIFYRQTIFYVTCEEALAEFWEYYLLRDTENKMDGLSDAVRAIFSIGEAILKLDGEPWIIVEADNDAVYFTINQVDVIGDLVFKLLMKKNAAVKEYKHENEKASFKLLHAKIEEEVEQEVVKEVQQVEEKVEEPVKEVEIKTTNIEDYEVFNYIDADDMSEVEECLGDLTSLMLIVGSSDLETSEVADIAQHLDKLGRTLSVYTESYIIGRSITTLSQTILSNADRFKEISADLSTLASAYVSDLQSWYKLTFFDGASSIDFMNDTISADSQTICAMLENDDTAVDESDMDDIFDF